LPGRRAGKPDVSSGRDLLAGLHPSLRADRRVFLPLRLRLRPNRGGAESYTARLVGVRARSNRFEHRRVEGVGHGVIGLVVALILTALALPPLLARLSGGRPRTLIAPLAALAPLAVVPASAAVIIAAATAGWPAIPLAVPAAILWIWQLPPRRRNSHQVAAGPSRESGAAPPIFGLRLLTINARGGAADPAAILRILQSHNVDVLAVQDLTSRMVSRLAAAGLGQLLPFSHLDPRPHRGGTGLWARWPLTPLPPVPGLTEPAPRARIDPPGGRAVTLTAVHPLAPMPGQADIWQRELALIRQTVAADDGPQVVAGDFNASRDHRPFRDLLAAGFLDCADSSPHRSWPGFTWPASGSILPVMRLDHVLVSRIATVRMARAIRVPLTDHHGVLAAIEFT
jgi:endonuclease/exonuclease/phosphatase (EEP) superfamily protein YafD